MQTMHAKLNDMNDIGEQIGTQLSNSPTLTNSINTKMDTLESKWNSLLEQMEYLSKVCTEQQQIELSKQRAAVSLENKARAKSAETHETTESTVKKQRLQASEIKEYKSIDTFVVQLNKVFEKVALLVNAETDLSPEEQQEGVKKADAEIRQHEHVMENMRDIAHSLVESMKASEQDTSEIESLVQVMNSRWLETRSYIDSLASSLERSCSQRKASDELATLRDVHEGYQRYINSAEPLSNDAQKLNLQLETNKVILQGNYS